MIDLWPDNIATHTGLRPPVAILKEQGVLLGRKTNNLVVGEASSSVFNSEGFQHHFYLVAPALGDYRYHLLIISHSVDMYPLQITATGEDILEELPAEMKSEDNALIADSEDKFMEILREIFATKKVRQVIEAIIAQSGVGVETE